MKKLITLILLAPLALMAQVKIKSLPTKASNFLQGDNIIIEDSSGASGATKKISIGALKANYGFGGGGGSVNPTNKYIPYNNSGTFADSYISQDTSVYFGGVKLSNIADPIADNDVASKYYVDQAVASLNARYYIYNALSGVSSYRNTSLNPSPNAEVSLTRAGLSGTTYVGGWISPNVFSAPELIVGTYSFRVTAEKVSGTKSVQLYWTLVERKTDTSEVIITTSALSGLVTGRRMFDIHSTLPTNYTLSAGSRIVGKLYAVVTGGGSAPDLRLYFEGSTSAGWTIPINTELLDASYLRRSDTTSLVATKTDLNLKANKITGINKGYIPYASTSDSTTLVKSYLKQSGNNVFMDINKTIATPNGTASLSFGSGNKAELRGSTANIAKVVADSNSVSLDYLDNVGTGNGGFIDITKTSMDISHDLQVNFLANNVSISGLTPTQLVATSGTKNLISLSTTTYPSLPEIAYVKGATSNIQTQINAKAPTASPTFTGSVTIPSPFTLGATSVTTNGTRLNYLASAGGTTGTTSTNLVFSTSPAFAGTPTAPTAGAGTNTTQIATTAFVTTAVSTPPYWQTVKGTPVRVGNTSFTITDGSNLNFYDKVYDRLSVLKWTDAGSTKMATIISATYATNTVTITIMGDILSATATMSTMKVATEKCEVRTLIIAGTMATGNALTAKYFSPEPMKFFGASANHGTAGTTNATTYTVSKNAIDGTGTVLSSALSIASGATTAGTGNTSVDGTSLVYEDFLVVNCTAVSTTAPIDAYVHLYLFPINSQYLQ